METLKNNCEWAGPFAILFRLLDLKVYYSYILRLLQLQYYHTVNFLLLLPHQRRQKHWPTGEAVAGFGHRQDSTKALSRAGWCWSLDGEKCIPESAKFVYVIDLLKTRANLLYEECVVKVWQVSANRYKKLRRKR
jgi:hypothetical protein